MTHSTDSHRLTRSTPFERRRFLRLPSTIDELLPQDHVARAVVVLMESNLVNLSVFYAAYSGRGVITYPPAMLLSLLLYRGMNGIYSTRKMERWCRFYDPCKFICNGHVPYSSTINRFRKRFRKKIQPIFIQVTRLLMETYTSEILDLDGTKILASACYYQASTWKQIQDKAPLLRDQVKEWDRQLDLGNRRRPRA